MIRPSLLKSDLLYNKLVLIWLYLVKTRVIFFGGDVSVNVKSQFCKWRSGSTKTHFLDNSLLLY